jgi:hypothetical protein
MPDGKVGHAELRLGVYVADEFPSEGQIAPRAGVRSPVGLVVHVDDVDAAVQQAGDAGATIDRDVVEEVFGARSAWLRDPFGHRWNLQQSSADDARRDAGRTQRAGLTLPTDAPAQSAVLVREIWRGSPRPNPSSDVRADPDRRLGAMLPRPPCRSGRVASSSRLLFGTPT